MSSIDTWNPPRPPSMGHQTHPSLAYSLQSCKHPQISPFDCFDTWRPDEHPHAVSLLLQIQLPKRLQGRLRGERPQDSPTILVILITSNVKIWGPLQDKGYRRGDVHPDATCRTAKFGDVSTLKGDRAWGTFIVGLGMFAHICIWGGVRGVRTRLRADMHKTCAQK